MTGIAVHLSKHHDVPDGVAQALADRDAAKAHSELHALGVLHMVTIRQPKDHRHVFGKRDG